MISFSAHDLPLLVVIGLSIYLFFSGFLLLVETSRKHKKARQRLQALGRGDGRPKPGQRQPTTKVQNWLDQSWLGRYVDYLVKEADFSWGLLTFLGIAFAMLPVVMVICSLLLQISFQQNAILSLILTFALLIGYLRSRQGKRERDLQAQVPEVALLLGNSLRAGLALHQGLAAVVEKLPRPANEEFGHLLNRINAGQSTEVALRRFLQDHPGEEIRMLITAVLIQRETGGDLSKTLSSISSAVLARQRLNDEIRTATAEGRFSSLAIVALSVAVLAILNMATGGVLKDFLQLGWSTIGLDWLDHTPLTLGFAVLFLVYILPQAMAFVWIRRISQVHI